MLTVRQAQATFWEHSHCGHFAGQDSREQAARVAAAILGAFAELRQLPGLLQCLSDAIPTSLPEEAADVVCSATFIAALQKVTLPPERPEATILESEILGTGTRSCL